MKFFFSYFDSGPMHGHHGYDNSGPDMRAIFVARGPGKYNNKHVSNTMVYKIDIRHISLSAQYQMK